MSNKPIPKISVGPGTIVSRYLTALNWTNKDLSDVINMSEKSISQIINHKQSITVESAILLSKAFNTSPEFWLNLEQNYRLREKLKDDDGSDIETKAKIRTYMPLLEMKKKGWIQLDKTGASDKHAYQEFWNRVDLDFSQFVNESESFPYCARQGKTDNQVTHYYTITWHQKALKEAQKIHVNQYHKENLVALFSRIPDYTLLPNGPETFIHDLGACGVKFFVLSHLSKTYLDGAAFLDGSNPVIVYTGRYDRVDHFWWTVTHEMVHVLNHIKSPEDCFLDNLDRNEDSQSISEQEAEADRETGRILKVSQILEQSRPYATYFTEVRLNQIAHDLCLSASVVLGILHHHKVIGWRTLAKVKQPVLGSIPKDYIKG